MDSKQGYSDLLNIGMLALSVLACRPADVAISLKAQPHCAPCMAVAWLLVLLGKNASEKLHYLSHLEGRGTHHAH